MSLYKKIQTVYQKPQPLPQEQVHCKSPKSPQIFNYATDDAVKRNDKVCSLRYDTIRYDATCYFSMQSNTGEQRTVLCIAVAKN